MAPGREAELFWVHYIHTRTRVDLERQAKAGRPAGGPPLWKILGPNVIKVPRTRRRRFCRCMIIHKGVQLPGFITIMPPWD